MSPDISDEIDLISYKFQDSNNYIIVNLYANGAFEQKDIDVLTETDSLEVSTPTGERWVFRLYDHVYSDQTEANSKINEAGTKTAIELRLYKQQIHITWPQLYSRQSIPITPKQENSNIDMIDQDINSAIQEQPYELSIKKLETEFIETPDNKAISKILIKEVYDCQVQFTDTNFTAIFNTNDEHFLEQHSIPLKQPIKLFVRVKERIKPDQSSHRVTPTFIEITLVKDYAYGKKWIRLEPDEYSAYRPLIPTLPPSTLPLPMTNTNSSINNNRAIPLPAPRSMDRQSDKYPNGSSFHQKDIIPIPTAIGFTGIYNPANSCFMNAALQCLSNTRELRDYFLQSYHCVELNRTNPLGMKGAMAEEFAGIIKSLWSGQSSYINANRLREYAAKRHQEFVGNGQHDAQELLTIVLDAVHEVNI
jgi:hypothetical protein